MSESERGLNDAVEATRTYQELLTLMGPRWDNPLVEYDVLWRLHCDRQKIMKEEEDRKRTEEEKKARGGWKIANRKKYKKMSGLGIAWPKIAKKTICLLKRNSS